MATRVTSLAMSSSAR
uniref:Uncharacterized protein n=1 Tax=Arundo donax TaxID=35708 RepID=A0A0A9FS35_ARUDO